MRRITLLFVCLTLCVWSFGQEYKIMYYNILWYNQDSDRDLDYIKILEDINPDILVAVELSKEYLD